MAALALIIGYALWSLAGTLSLRANLAGHLFRSRNAQALVGLLPCLLLAALCLPSLRMMHGWMIGVGGAASFLAFAAADPNRVGFWHHRRLRPVGILVTGTVGLALGVFLPDAAWIPPLFATAIFHLHQRRTATLMAQSFDDLEGLRQKLQTLEAEARTRVLQSSRDKGTKAG